MTDYATKNSVVETSSINLDKVISERLKSIRISKKLTQKQIAEKLNLKSQQSYSQYETGNVKISASTLYTLSEIFEVNVEFFFPDNSSNNVFKNDKLSLKEQLRNKLKKFRTAKNDYDGEISKLEHILNKLDDLN